MAGIKDAAWRGDWKLRWNISWHLETTIEEGCDCDYNSDSDELQRLQGMQAARTEHVKEFLLFIDLVSPCLRLCTQLPPTTVGLGLTSAEWCHRNGALVEPLQLQASASHSRRIVLRRWRWNCDGLETYSWTSSSNPSSSSCLIALLDPLSSSSFFIFHYLLLFHPATATTPHYDKNQLKWTTAPGIKLSASWSLMRGLGLIVNYTSACSMLVPSST